MVLHAFTRGVLRAFCPETFTDDVTSCLNMLILKINGILELRLQKFKELVQSISARQRIK